MSINQKEFNEKIVETVVSLTSSATVEIEREILLQYVQSAIQMIKLSNPEADGFQTDTAILVEKILRIRNAGTTFHRLDASTTTDHQEWLDNKRSKILDGVHWNAFKRYLQRQLSSDQLKEVDDATDSILGSIEDPEREGDWFSRGLVIGDVQSGKTTNFVALCNKALDAGYMAIVVLSGLHNNLRQQTQIRFEEGVTGFNSGDDVPASKKVCGVAINQGKEEAEKLRVAYLTNRGERGDFVAGRSPGIILGNAPIFSVNKKNKDTLGHLIRFFRGELASVDASDVPILLIDDEADNASIDTSSEDESPSRINALIKELLGLFPKKAYIGYTATPFANVLINPEEDDDLFPHNFISILGRPENYIGASKVFGEISDLGKEKGGDEAEIVDRETDLNWFVNLDDKPYFSDWRDFIPAPNKQSSIHSMTELPLSIAEAVYCFLISVSVRNLRGDKYEHKTMLIHCTRLLTLQERLLELVEDWVDEIYNAMVTTPPSGDNKYTREMRDIFETRYPYIPESWQSVRDGLTDAVSETRNHVFAINGNSKDVIDESRYPNGLTSIRIGGDKLSRGLTLPGLITSYFIRVSKPYDTLMQMGRWFGYRDNYDDICQIFTTSQLFNWFGHVANASERLRSRIFEKNRENLEPTEYRQQILSHPGAMLVTALNKQRHSRHMAISFAGDLEQLTTYEFGHNFKLKQKENLTLIKDLLSELKDNTLTAPELTAYIFNGINADRICTFIAEFYHSTGAGTWHSESLCKYIKKMAEKGELTNWTVAFQTSSRPHASSEVFDISGWPMTSNVRNGKMHPDGRFTLANRGLVSAGHEKFDFSPEERKKLLGLTRKEVQKKRPPTRGLLIIYLVTAVRMEKKKVKQVYGTVPALAISFPSSDNGAKVTYVVGTGFDKIDDEAFN